METNSAAGRPASPLRDVAIIGAVSLVVLFTNLGGPKLWDRDEPRNAGCAVEMMARGDWVVPVFNAELRTHKPVLLYWMMIASYSVFGVSEFSARFGSAVLGIGTALMTYAVGRRMFSARVGLWAGIILSTSLMFDVASRAATPDSVLIFFTTAAVSIYCLATFRSPATGTLRNEPFPPWSIAAAMYAMMGFAVLAKGPIGLVVPTAVIGMYMLIVRLPERAHVSQGLRGRLRSIARPFAPFHFLRTCWVMRPVTAIAIALAIALPWYVWVGVRTDGQWLRGFFLEHNLGRATQAMEGHGGSLFYYPIALLIGFFPWSVFAVPTLIWIKRRLESRGLWSRSTLFCVCWVGVYVGLFSIARTKLPSYVTPCYPALALLTAGFIDHWMRGTTQVPAVWPRIAAGSMATVGLVIVIAIPIAAHRYLPGDEWLGVIGAAPLLGGVLALGFMIRGRRPAAAYCMAVTAIAFTTSLFGFATLRADRHQRAHHLLDEVTRGSDQAEIVWYGGLEPSWVFYAGMPIRQLDKRGVAPDVPVATESWQPLPPVNAHAFLAQPRDRFVITTDRYLEELGPLPPAWKVLAEVPYFLKKDRLILLGPVDTHTARRQ